MFRFHELVFTFCTANAHTSYPDRNPNVTRCACLSNLVCKRRHNESAGRHATGLIAPEGQHLTAKRLVSLLPVYK